MSIIGDLWEEDMNRLKDDIREKIKKANDLFNEKIPRYNIEIAEIKIEKHRIATVRYQLDDGEFVLYKDHIATIEKLQQIIQEIENRL